MVNNFRRDLEQEQFPIEFLKKYFFNPYIACQKKIRPEYVTDIETQLTGIDIILNYEDEKKVNIDIKAQMNKYINHPTPTFCLETEYTKQGVIHEGWLFRDDLKTDIYGFIWINSADCDKKHLLHSCEDINKLTILFVHKSDVLKYLGSLGIDKKSIEDSTRKLKTIPGKNGTRQDKLPGDLKLFQTLFLPEQPINIVVPNRIWDELACAKYVVTKEQIQILKENRVFCDKTITTDAD